MEVRLISIDGSLRSRVAAAATSVLTRLQVALSAADAVDHVAPLRLLLLQTTEYIEQTLHELVSVFPEPEYDLQGNAKDAMHSSAVNRGDPGQPHQAAGQPVGGRGEGGSSAKASLDDVGVKGGNSNVLLTPAVLLDERSKIDDMQLSMDPNMLKRCIALLRMQLVEAELQRERDEVERNALIASHKRRVEGLDYARQAMEKEILNLRRTVLKEEPMMTKDIFSSIDTLLLLGGGDGRNAALTDDRLLQRVNEALALFQQNPDARDAFADESMQRALDRIAETEERRKAAEERVRSIGQRMHENEDRARHDMVAMQRRERELRATIAELHAKLQTDKAAWIALERELETVRADKDALIQAVALAESKTKQQRQELYVHIATISQQLLVEKKKYTMSFEEEPDPLNVDLVQQIAETGIATDLSPETLQRMLQATQRPDDPSKIAAQENLVDRCEHLRKDVRAWKSVALDSGLHMQLLSVEKADLEEDLMRVIGFSKDNNLPVPLDLVKSRFEADHINAFNDNTNFKEVCRTMRTDAKVAARRLHEIRYRMEGIVPMAARTARGDALATFAANQPKPQQSVAEAAQYARGSAAAQQLAPPPPPQAAASGGGDSGSSDVPRDELGSLLEEVELTERVEQKMRECLLDNAKTIRQLRLEKQEAEKARVSERVTWVDQWCNLLGQLPPVVAQQIHLDGISAVSEAPIIVEEFNRIKEEHKQAAEQERQNFVAFCEKEKQQLEVIAQHIETEKKALEEERHTLAKLDPAALALQRRKSVLRLQASCNGDDDSAEAVASAMQLDRSAASADVFSLLRSAIITHHQEMQTDDPLRDDAETTTDDVVLYQRRFKSRETETKKVQLSERGSQAHVLGDDFEIQCDLGPKFDREAAAELFQDLGHLFDGAEKERKMLISVESPPRCGSPAFPARFLCPSCGESIQHVSKGIFGPTKTTQTEPCANIGGEDGDCSPSLRLRRRKSSVRRRTISREATPRHAVIHCFEALHTDVMSAEDVPHVARLAARQVEIHGGVLLKAASFDGHGDRVYMHTARFATVLDAVTCAAALHEFQRELLASGNGSGNTSASTRRGTIASPMRVSGATIHTWPPTRGGIATGVEDAVALCSISFSGETLVHPDADVAAALISTPASPGVTWTATRRTVLLESASDSSPGAATRSDPPTQQCAAATVEAVSVTLASRVSIPSSSPPSVTEAGLSARDVLLCSVQTLDNEKDCAEITKEKVREAMNLDADAMDEEFEETWEVMEHGTQTEPVVVMKDDELAALQKRSASRSNTPLLNHQAPTAAARPSSTASSNASAPGPLRTGSGKPSSAAMRHARPLTASMRQFALAIGQPMRMSPFDDAVIDIWRAVEPFATESLRTAPHRAFSAEEMPLIPLLFEAAAISNVRALLGYAEGDAESQLRLYAMAVLQQSLLELGLTEYSLPSRVPYAVVVRQPGTMSIAGPSAPSTTLLSSSSISDAFRPILHLLTRVSSAPPIRMQPLLPIASSSSRPPTGHAVDGVLQSTLLAPQDQGRAASDHGVRAIHDKLRELEALTRETLTELMEGGGVPANLQPSSPPPMLSAYMGWEVPHDAPEPIGAEDMASRSPRRGLGRVVVRPLQPTVTIRKSAVVNDLQPVAVSATSALNHTHSLMLQQRRLPTPVEHSGRSGAAGRTGGRGGLLRPIAGRRAAPLADESSFASHQPPRHSLPSTKTAGREDASMQQTLHALPAQLPPVSDLAEVFAATFGTRGLDSRGSVTSLYNL